MVFHRIVLVAVTESVCSLTPTDSKICIGLNWNYNWRVHDSQKKFYSFEKFQNRLCLRYLFRLLTFLINRPVPTWFLASLRREPWRIIRILMVEAVILKWSPLHHIDITRSTKITQKPVVSNIQNGIYLQIPLFNIGAQKNK